MKTVDEIIKTIGRKNIEAAFDVGSTRISNIKGDGFFPSAWYVELIKLAADSGITIPISLFAFKKVNEKLTAGQGNEVSHG